MEENHALCGGTEACLDQVEVQQRVVERAHRARGFDASKGALGRRGEQPTSWWSTSELLRTVLDGVVTPPHTNWLWRSITITTALARLGERGLSPDAVIRTGFGHDLIRRAIMDAAVFWLAEREGRYPPESTPRFLRGWVGLLDAQDSFACEDASFAWVAQAALASSPAETARNWLRSAAVGDLISWKVTGYLEVPRGPDEIVFPGGKDATRWVCDRLGRTFLTDWHAPSLQWELAYIRSPGDTAARAGVDPSILDERVSTEDMVISEMCRRLHTPGVRDVVDAELRAEDLIPSLGLLLKEGRLDDARSQARRAWESYPGNPDFQLAYAFCSIPSDRAEAARILGDLEASDDRVRATVTANLATCALFEGLPERAAELVAEMSSPYPAGDVWLWDPVAALNGRAEVRVDSVDRWVQRLQLLGQST
ncbi:MAG: tetratricopeptide repeat protein [Nigerium sp.]|nr:tetratricopeptide repeat protein [Nigerium sp.]